MGAHNCIKSSSAKSCTYVAVDESECLHGWNCDYHYADEYFAQDGYHYDYDCEGNLAECPMDATDLFHGAICEADAACYMEGGNPTQGVVCDLNDRPAGTSANEDNCGGKKDVYKVQCTSTLDIEDFDCSYVPVTECPLTYNCYYDYDEQDHLGKPEYDCGAIDQCPMVINDMSMEGMICEADADADGFMPAGTAYDLDNCDQFDVYEVVCVAKPKPETTAPEATTEDPAAVSMGDSCDGLGESDCGSLEYCSEKFKKSGVYKKCKSKQCSLLDETMCINSPHCDPRYHNNGNYKRCRKM